MTWRKTSLLYSTMSCMLALVAAPPAHADVADSSRSRFTNVSVIENKGSYKLFSGETALGEIDVYIGNYGAFVSLDTIVNKLGYSLYRDDSNRTAQITFPDGSTLMFNFDRDEYMRKGQVSSLGDNDYVVIGPYVFLSTSFMNQVFPVGFSLDEAARKLRIEKMGQLTVPVKQLAASAESQAPAQPLAKDETAAAEAIKPETGNTDVLRIVESSQPINTPAPPPPEPSPSSALMTPLPDGLRSSAVDESPVPLASPRMPVLVDDFSQRGLGQYPKLETEGQDVIHETEGAASPLPSTPIPTTALNGSVAGEAPVPLPLVEQPSAPPPVSSTPPPPDVIQTEQEAAKSDEDNDLIIQPKIKRLPLSDIFIEAFERGSVIYLPFNDMMALLEIPLKTNAAGDSVEGNLPKKPPQAFSFNLQNKEVSLDGDRLSWVETDAVKKNGKLYISLSAFEKWFGIKPDLKRNAMILRLDAAYVLPVEARLQRHQLWDKLLSTNKSKDTEGVEVLQNPYQLAAWPSVDVNLSSNLQSNGKGGPVGNENYSILSGGDLGYLTTSVLATGSDKTPLSNLRVTAGRKDPNAELLGDMQATDFEFGDIQSPTLDNVTGDPTGRGVVVTNRSLNASSGFDVHTFVGNAFPGWEVELYRNKILLAFQTIGADGRYTFVNIPLLYGNNDFHIVLYGPQGQTEERVETLLVGSSMLKEGKFEYTVSANQKDLGAFDALTAKSNPDASQDLRAVSQLRYGFTKEVTGGVGLVQTSVQETPGVNVDHRYASATVDLDLGTAFVDLNTVRDINGGWVGGVTALTSIDDISLRLRHRQFSNFESETETVATGLHKTDSEIDADGQFYAPLIQDYNLGWKIEKETFMTLAPKLTYTSSFSKTVWGMSLSNSLSYVKSTTKQTQGTAGLQTSIGGVLVRADAQYEVMPQEQFQDANVTTEYRLTKDISAQTKIDKQIAPLETISLSQSLNWNFDKFQLSLTGNADDHQNYAVGLSLVFSLARDSTRDEWNMQRQSAAGAGSIATRIFQDDNFDGKYVEGETVIADARPRLNQLPLSGSIQDATFISPVIPYDPVHISVDPSSLNDPMLSPETKGYKVVTRPGDTVLVDLPVISTSEVDGVVKIVDDTAARIALPDIVVELLDMDGNVVQRVISESEGYFIFDKVRPGNYKISVPAEALAEYSASLITPISVTVAKTSDFLTDNNLLLYTKSYADAMKQKQEPKAQDAAPKVTN